MNVNTGIARLTSVIVLSVALVLLSIGIYGGRLATKTLWPGLHNDASLFSTVIINRANGLGNTFDSYTYHLFNAKGNKNFNVHGQLYYPIIAAMMPGGGYERLLLILHWLNYIAFGLSLILFYNVARRHVQTSSYVALFCGVSCAFANVAALQYLQGRPDHGVVLILLLFCVLDQCLLKGRIRPVLTGVVTGCVAAITPIPGYITGVAIVISELFDARKSAHKPHWPSWFTWIVNSMLSLGIALVTWVLLTKLVYPWPISNLFNLTFSTGLTSYPALRTLFYKFPRVSLISPTGISEYWLTLKFVPLISLPLLYASILVLIRTFRTLVTGVGWVTKILLIAILIVISGQLWFFVASWPEINYVLIGLLPGILYWSLRQSARFDKVSYLSVIVRELNQKVDCVVGVSGRQLKTASIIIFSITALAPGLGYLRTSLLQSAILDRGVSFIEARQRFQSLQKTLADDEYILISSTGWKNTLQRPRLRRLAEDDPMFLSEYRQGSGRNAIVLDGPPWRSRSSDFGDDLNRCFINLRPKYYFHLQDSVMDIDVPEHVFGYRLIEKRFTPNPVRIFGLQVATVTPGYGYVVYENINNKSR